MWCFGIKVDLRKVLNGNFQGSRKAPTGNDDSCTSIKSRVFPRVWKNTKNQNRFIVQKSKLKFKQAVTTNVCVSSNQTCEISVNGHTHSGPCEQRKTKITLKVFDLDSKEKNNVLVDDEFDLPSCCVCTIDKKSNIFKMI